MGKKQNILKIQILNRIQSKNLFKLTNKPLSYDTPLEPITHEINENRYIINQIISRYFNNHDLPTKKETKQFFYYNDLINFQGNLGHTIIAKLLFLYTHT